MRGERPSLLKRWIVRAGCAAGLFAFSGTSIAWSADGELSSSLDGGFETPPGLGFAAGTLSGVGIAYRRHWTNAWGIGVTGIAWGNAEMLFADLGVNFMRTLSLKGSTRFYLVMGASGFVYSMSTTVLPGDGTCTGDCGEGETYRASTLDLNTGGGIGMEFLLTSNLGLAVELPLSLMWRLANDRTLPRFGLNGIYPVPSAALIYYF